MAIRISELSALSGALSINDLLEIVDVSDTSMAASGTSKKITVSKIRDLLISRLKDPATCGSGDPVTLNTTLQVGQVLDGVTLADGDRVLLLAQEDPNENGLWQVVASSNPTRPADFASGTTAAGSFVTVKYGTYAGYAFTCINPADEDLVDTYQVLFSNIALVDGDKGDITVSSDGSVMTVNSGAVSAGEVSGFDNAAIAAALQALQDSNSILWTYNSGTHQGSATVQRRTTGLSGTQGTLSESGSGLTVDLGTTANTACAGNDARLTNARTPLSHASSHKHGGSDEVAVSSAAANAIPKANSSGVLDIGWFPLGTTGTTLCVGNDTRLTNARTPTAHAATHGTGSTDPITIAESQVTNLVTHLAAKVDTAGSGLTKSSTTLSLSNQAASTLMGNNTGSSAAPTGLTVSQVKTLLAYVAGDISGLGTMAAQDASNVSITGGAITGLSNPVNASDAVNKSYVDTLSSGLQWKTPVRVATTTSGTLSSSFANGQTVDGVTLATNDRILIKDQSTATENGIYLVNSSGAPTRTGDADSGSELSFAAVTVQAGSTNIYKAFLCTSTSITLGSTDVNFVNFSATISGALMATNNLSDLSSISTARTNLELGDVATLDIGTTTGTVAAGDDSRFSDARVPLTHSTSHKHGGGDEIATATAGANAIPKAGVGGTLAIGWIPLGSTSSTVCVGNDSRLSDSRDPNLHATSHKAAGSDEILLDELGTPTDNTDLNVTTSYHGLMPKLSGDVGDYFAGDGTYQLLPTGRDGIDSFTTLSTNFNLPAVGATQSITVGNTGWMAEGQWIVIIDGSNSAYVVVTTITDSTTVTIRNTNASINAAPSTTFNSGAAITPAGPEGPTILGGAVAVLHTFDTTTTNSDPGSGKLRLNNATQNTATAAYISKLDANGASVATILTELDAANSTIKGYLRVVNRTNPADWLLFSISARTDHTNYAEITLTNIGYSGSSPLNSLDDVVWEFTRNGDIGSGSAVSAQANNTLFGNVSGSTATPGALTVSQVKTLLSLSTSDISGLGTMATQSASSVNITGGTITGLSTPSGGSDAVNKTYVDSLIQGLKWKTPVQAASTANGTLASSFANGQTLDGYTLVTGDRILLKDQTAGSENGVYTVNSSGAPTRATDADVGSELVSAYVLVLNGTSNADKGYVCTNTSITLETTAVTFVNISSATGSFVSGPGTSTDKALARWSGTGGYTVQNSNVTLSDAGKLHLVSSYHDAHAVTSSSGTATFDMDVSNFHTITLSESTTIAFSNVSTGQEFRLLISMNANSIAGWPAGITWSGGSAPSLSTSSWYLVKFTCTGSGAYRASLEAAGTGLPVTMGGTGLTSGTSGGIPYFSSSTAISSSSALTANAIVIGGGAGVAPSASGVSLDSNNNISGYGPKINAQTGTTYTLQQSDSGKIVECSNASAITVTLPNSLSNFCCRIVQTGAGQVTLSAASGATLHNSQSFTKTSGQWAELDLYVTSNSGGSSAVYIMAGDGA